MDLDKRPAQPGQDTAGPAPSAAAIRASDADRDRTARILGDALAEGRLTADEHAERIDALFTVKTVGELDRLVRDLPAGVRTAPHAGSALPDGARPYAGEPDHVVAVCSGTTRRGRWRPAPHTRAVAVMGDVTLDLTEATFEQQLTEINVTCLLGNVEILVPENITLRGFGNGFLANFEVHADGSEHTDPQAPVVIVRGFSVLGNIEARKKSGKRLVDLAARMRKQG
ncbi:DUF1707 domain-containing protein [Streptomyces bambusae]|uniref:DUF1707 SHOCT-like domain-containing protein n=1 Tax=Streptomyces bambusae TaxID=1550616 RepID=UPI001CFDA6C3|nr:DUF1707 domain-containing protein [Streptomyces bambusae]MCB5166877.1 DUF1707 domain-containing protein [Streptomyces bambusae]